MNGISHKQAIKLIHRRLDGLLSESQVLLLDEHLNSCDTCRAYASEIDLLPTYLQSEFHARWDQEHGPSEKVFERVKTKARRIPTLNRISSGIKLAAGVATLVALGFLINLVFSQLRGSSTSATTTETAVLPTQSNERSLAFASDQNGNFDIYTMHADGSELTNLTNNPAVDTDPFWSPDGKRIAFVSGRDGSAQIYLMDADGSNVVQLTKDEGAHAFANYFIDFGPWSPDGRKLVFTETLPGEEKWKLYVIDASGENKTLLVGESNIYNAISWSPDGQRVAFLADDPQNLGGDRIYVVNADGSDLREITKSFSPNEQLSMPDYYWSQDGQSIFFVAFFQKTDPYWTAYEARLEDDSLIEHATTNDMMYGWWNDIYMVNNFSASAPFEWVRPDGTSSIFNPTENCEHIDLYQSDHTAKRSPNGNWVMTGQCANGDTWFYWANSDGTQIKPLLDSPISITNTFLLPISWSRDDKFVAFTSSSSDESDLYILNVSAALNDRAIQPVKISKSYGLSWQPVTKNQIVYETPTPEPTSDPTQAAWSDDLIIFTAESDAVTNGSTDIYTVRTDGSQRTNLTHDPAKDWNGDDYNPRWSSDRKKIAFISDRGGGNTGDVDIFTVNSDGSNLIRLTNKAGYDVLYAWSPIGNQIVYFSSSGYDPYIQGQLIVMNSDGSNKTVITREMGFYYFRSWSPDGRKIIYAKQTLHDGEVRNDGLYIVDVNGENEHQLSQVDIGDIHWEDSEHFVGIVGPENREQPEWSLYRFSIQGNSPLKLASHDSPIVAIFDETYVVESQDMLNWFTLKGGSSLLSTWNLADVCKTVSDGYYRTYHTLAPDRRLAFVSLRCDDATWFYLENEDGTEILKLGTPVDDSPSLLAQWSLDEKYVSVRVFNGTDYYVDTDLYLFDIQQMRKDPSSPPNRTFLGQTVEGERMVVWPPENGAHAETKPPAEPLTFPLSLDAAQLLAQFDLMEPAYLPDSYTLEGIAHDPWSQKFIMDYVSAPDEGSILLYQGRGDLFHYPEIQPYVTPVTIGDIAGEFIQGDWINDSSGTPTWNETAKVYSLNWQHGDMVFSIRYLGESTDPSLLDDLLAIANSLK